MINVTYVASTDTFRDDYPEGEWWDVDENGGLDIFGVDEDGEEKLLASYRWAVWVVVRHVKE